MISTNPWPIEIFQYFTIKPLRFLTPEAENLKKGNVKKLQVSFKNAKIPYVLKFVMSFKNAKFKP